MTPDDALQLHMLLVDTLTNAMDAIKLVDEVSKGMDPADVKSAIATAMLRSGLVPTTASSRAWLRYADAPTVTH